MRRPSLLRAGATAVVTASVLAIGAAPALAHARLDISTAPADTPIDLTISVPNERPDEPGMGNQQIEAAFPAGFTVRGCEVPTSAWTCSTASGSDGRTIVTWRTVVGAPDDMTFPVSIRTPKAAGRYLIPVVQTYNDGEESPWIADGGASPAPVLTITADGPVEEATQAPVDHGASDAPAPAPAATTQPAPPTNSAPTQEPAPAPATTVSDSPTPQPTEQATEQATDEATPTQTEAPTASPSPTVAITPTPTDDGSGSVLPLVLGVLLLGGAGAAAVMMRRGPTDAA